MVVKNYLQTAYAYSADGTDGFTTVYPNLNLLDGTATFDRMGPNSSNISVSTITKTKISGITNTVMDVKTSGNASSVGFYLPNAYNITAEQTVTISFMARAFDDAKVWVGFENFENGNKVFTITTNWELYTYTFTATKSATSNFVIYGLDMVADQHFQVYNYKAELGSTATPYMPSSSEVTTADWPKYVGTYVDTNPTPSTDPSKYDWDEMKYRVYLDGIPVGGSKLMSFDLENLKADTTYNVQVNQINGNIESDKSESVAFKTTLTK